MEEFTWIAEKTDKGHRMIVQGGKAVYGANVGILMLEARFPRIPGDMGNALTWPFPVLYKVIRDATPDRVVRNQAEGLFDDFLKGARELIADGADVITTNCGFLSLYQSDLANALDVPVATSSLMQVPMVETMLAPGKKVGIITISAESLTTQHLEAAGCASDSPFVGMPANGAFSDSILNNKPELDVEAARSENVAAAKQLIAEHQNIGALVLECTNMVPYAHDIQAATGLPVFSIYNFVCWLQAGFSPPSVWRQGS